MCQVVVISGKQIACKHFKFSSVVVFEYMDRRSKLDSVDSVHCLLHKAVCSSVALTRAPPYEHSKHSRETQEESEREQITKQNQGYLSLSKCLNKFVLDLSSTKCLNSKVFGHYHNGAFTRRNFDISKFYRWNSFLWVSKSALRNPKGEHSISRSCGSIELRLSFWI